MNSMPHNIFRKFVEVYNENQDKDKKIYEDSLEYYIDRRAFPIDDNRLKDCNLSQEEIIEETLGVIEACMKGLSQHGNNSPHYHATAGAPLVGKSTLLENKIINGELEKNVLYIGPDRTVIQGVTTYNLTSDKGYYPGKYYRASGLNCYWKTYDEYIKAGKTEQEAHKLAYETHRVLSCWIAETVIILAAHKNMNIAHDVTNTSNMVHQHFKSIQNLGFKAISLDVINAHSTFRKAALAKRAVYQVTPGE